MQDVVMLPSKPEKFLRAAREFGYSDFDTINVSVTTGGTGKANPERVYGAFALGVRF